MARGDKSNRTRAQLLESAKQVFLDKGYHDAKVVDIIERAGCGHGTFYDYFKSKEDVLLALLEGLVQDMQKMGESIRPLLERLSYDDLQGVTIVIQGINEMFNRYGELHQVYMQAIWESKRVRRLFLDFHHLFSSLMREKIVEMQETGRCQGMDPDVVSQIIVNTIGFTNFAQQDGIIEADTRSVSENLSRLLFNALNFS